MRDTKKKSTLIQQASSHLLYLGHYYPVDWGSDGPQINLSDYPYRLSPSELRDIASRLEDNSKLIKEGHDFRIWGDGSGRLDRERS